MIKLKEEGILLKKSNQEFENEGVLNPATGAALIDGTLSTMVPPMKATLSDLLVIQDFKMN